MSNTKTVMGQASNQYVKPLDITDVFSTYLYTGNGSTQTITNDIDLAGEGGLVWVKDRSFASDHGLFDTERGKDERLRSNTTNASTTNVGWITSFNSNGFGVGSSNSSSGSDYASWTFRKAPKFFDVVTYTGDGNDNRQISHSLGSAPATIIIKSLNFANNWLYNTNFGASSYDLLYLDLTNAASSQNYSTGAIKSAPTDSTFTLKNSSSVNGSGNTYVAYLFAHNDGDGGFGPDGDADIIKCGSYSQSSASDVDVDLGFEPQFVIVKRSDNVSQWYVLDEMRGFLAGSNSTSSRTLYANLSNAEADFTIQKTATGFTWPSGQYGSGTQEYIYMAIRRGPLAQPESGTEVFAIDTRTGNQPSYVATFEPDMAIKRNIGIVLNNSIAARLTGTGELVTNDTAAESSDSGFLWDYMDGWANDGSANSDVYSWMWKRAPGYFDVVAYTGTNVAGLTINHNLGVVPEMIWVKNRSAAEYWAVYHKDLNGGTNPSHYFLRLNTTNAETDYNEIWNDTEPTATQFTVGQQGVVNGFEQNHIAYLFATLPGVSKVGSYSGDGTTDGSKVIDCGFTSGARFVLIKAYNTGGDWMVYDTTRGIVVGNDPILSLNDTAAEATTYDNLIPNSSGFAVIQNTDGAYTTNESGHSYIFYAIA